MGRAGEGNATIVKIVMDRTPFTGTPHFFTASFQTTSALTGYVAVLVHYKVPRTR